MKDALTWLQSDPGKWAMTGAVLLAIGLAALAFEWLRDKVSGYLAPLIVSIVLLVLALLIHPLRARDLDGRHAGSALKPWFDQLKNKQGDLCCSDADGTAISDADWRSSIATKAKPRKSTAPKPIACSRQNRS